MRLPFRNRQVDPFLQPGTEVSLQAQISEFWAETFGTGTTWSPRLVDRVWAVNRCMQLTANHIAAMPLRFFGPPSATEPAWVSSPDPTWFPNGVGDAMFAAAWSMYGAGDAFLYVTGTYANGFPSSWTVLDPYRVDVKAENGRRRYTIGTNEELDPDRVVQISRDPRGGLRGTSALVAYAAAAWGLITASETASDKQTAVPPIVLRADQKLTEAQATALREQWSKRPSKYSGIPVLDPRLHLEATQVGLSPKDLLLLESQAWDAKTIAAAFGVPPFLLNLALEGGLVYQAPGQLFDYWWRNELYPTSKRIAGALTAQMLPRGQSVQFDARETLAPDLKDLADVWTKAFENGLVSRDEWRVIVLGQPPQSEAESIQDLLLPPVTATSPNVAQLRPPRASTSAVGVTP